MAETSGEQSTPEQPTENSEVLQSRNISRRTLLCALAGGVGMAAWLEFITREPDAPPDVPSIEEKDRASEFAASVEEGLTYRWEHAAIWPGIMVLNADVALYDRPVQLNRKQLPWPASLDGRLIVQRPFFIRDSVMIPDNNLSRIGGNPTELMGQDTTETLLGFWLPDVNQLAYFDFAESDHQVLLAMRDSSKRFSEDGTKPISENVTLADQAYDNRGLVWRYMQTERVQFAEDLYDGASQPDAIHKVCGRSIVRERPQDVRQALKDYNNFELAYKNIIELPLELQDAN